jgi:hypothetical protein
MFYLSVKESYAGGSLERLYIILSVKCIPLRLSLTHRTRGGVGFGDVDISATLRLISEDEHFRNFKA